MQYASCPLAQFTMNFVSIGKKLSNCFKTQTVDVTFDLQMTYCVITYFSNLKTNSL